MEDAEAVQLDTVAVGQGLAHLADDGFAHVLHVFGRHAAEGFDVLCQTAEVEDFSIFGLALQGVDHGRPGVSDFFATHAAYY